MSGQGEAAEPREEHARSVPSVDAPGRGAPVFSFIVPVHGTEGFLRRCLESLVRQEDAPPLEIIVVDDASPDGAPAIAEEFAQLDRRVRVLHHDHNRGLGAARNSGLAAARGDYVLFVDSDDWLHPASAALLARGVAEPRPDVVLFDFCRVDYRGRSRPNPNHRILAAHAGARVALAEAPELLDLVPLVVNKAYRRRFVTDHGLRFSDGFYEDTPWSYSALMLAERIAVVDEVLYHYRQRLEGNILRTRTRRHFDIFDQWARVYAVVDARPDLERFRSRLFSRMTLHLVTILRNADGRLRPEDRQEFFERSSEEYQRRDPGGGAEVPAADRPEVEALASGSYRRFLWALHRSPRGPRRHVPTLPERIERGARAAARSSLTQVRRARYARWRRGGTDPGTVVLGSAGFGAFRGDAAELYREFERREGFTPHWVVRGDRERHVPGDVRRLVVGQADYYRVMARAGCVILEADLPGDVVKPAGTTFLRLDAEHPLTFVGADRFARPASGAATAVASSVRRSLDWDVRLASGARSREVLLGAYPVDLEVWLTGMPRNDVLIRAGDDEVVSARGRLGLAADGPTVLYAPGRRPHRRSSDPPVSVTALCEVLPEDATLLTTARVDPLEHAGVRSLLRAGRLVDVSEADRSDVLLSSDAMVTDYDSSLLDYVLLDRPVVLHLPDEGLQRAVAGLYLDLDRVAPGRVTRTSEELLRVVGNGIEDRADDRDRRQAFRLTYLEAESGAAAAAVVDRLTHSGGRPPQGW